MQRAERGGLARVVTTLPENEFQNGTTSRRKRLWVQFDRAARAPDRHQGLHGTELLPALQRLRLRLRFRLPSFFRHGVSPGFGPLVRVTECERRGNICKRRAE